MAHVPLVYLATNVLTGDLYVGKTIAGLRKRRGSHIVRARNGSRTHFHQALRRYGSDNFSWAVLSEHDTAEQATAAEVEWIAKLKPAYNITAGGDGGSGMIHGPETREKIAAIWRGKKQTPDHIAKRTGPLRGRKASSAQRAKQSASRRANPPKNARPVICIDDGGIYPSVGHAARAYGASVSAINELCSGRNVERHRVVGRRFSFVEPRERECAAINERESKKYRTWLSLEEISIIRESTESKIVIAERYGVTIGCISSILSGRRGNRGK